MKSDREIMEILEAFDATGSAHSAAVLAGVDAKTVRRYVAARDAGVPVTGPGRRPRRIDGYLPKVGEGGERSSGKVRADVVDERLVAPGLTGAERATRRAAAEGNDAGVDARAVRRYVAARDAGVRVTGPGRRPRMIDGYLPKVEEWVERSSGKVRADVVHERLVALGFTGTERTTRRAVAQVKAAWRAGHRRTYRPWITEPGLWLQFDWGEGPKVPGPDGTLRRTWLFCAWLAWSRFRVVIPVWDQTLPTLITCLDATLHRLGGVPTYVL